MPTSSPRAFVCCGAAAPDVYALAQPHAPHRPLPLFDGTPVRVLLLLAFAAFAVWALAAAGLAPMTLARAVAAGAAQGSLLAVAVGWTAGGSERADRLALGIALTALVGAVAAASAYGGAVAYLLAPLWLWRRRSRLSALGLHAAPARRLLIAGLGLGVVLAGHLIITASLTLGYRIALPAAAELLPWLAYDLGANVLAAECFFRAALFDRGQRRWSFAAATALSTAASVARYLVDPLLPSTIEVMAGAAFYLTLLSAGNCWLYWLSGSVTPGLVAGCAFFAVYRLLHVGP